MLFDLEPTEKKKPKAVAVPAAPLPEFRPPPLSVAPILGQIEDVFQCIDSSCRAGLLDIVEEYSGVWSLQCVFCGTGQRVKAIKGYLKPKDEEFVFPSGDYAGKPLSAVAADPRGMAYIEWAAEEHKSDPVKAACKTFLDALKPAP